MTMRGATVPGLVVALGVGLSGCGLLERTVPPACPEVLVVPDAAQVTRFQPGTGRDLIDITFDGGIVDYKGYCEYDLDEETGAGSVTVQVTLSMTAERGAANRDRQAVFDYFVSVTDANRNILAKDVFRTNVEFPGNISRLTFEDDPVEMMIPLTAKTRGRDFRVYVGYQLGEDELRYNRRRMQSTR